METMTVRDKMVSRIQHMASNAIIRNRRYLDDEQLIRSEQLAVLDEIFNANVRDAAGKATAERDAQDWRGARGAG